MLFALLPNEAFLSWGWRVPFLLGIALLLVGLFIRLQVFESPLFAKVLEQNQQAAVPLLKDGVRDDPANAQAWLALGMAYQNIGQDRAAKQPYQEYLKLKPKGATSDEIRAALEAMK